MDLNFAKNPRLITVKSIRHHTRGSAERDMTAPKMAVKPNRIIEKCKAIYERKGSFMNNFSINVIIVF